MGLLHSNSRGLWVFEWSETGPFGGSDGRFKSILVVECYKILGLRMAGSCGPQDGNIMIL